MCAVHHGFNECCEKADRRKGNNSNTHIRRFDGRIKEGPLTSKQSAHAHDGELVFTGDFFKAMREPRPKPQTTASDHDTPKDNEAWRKAHEFAKDARPASEQNRDMKL